MYTVKKYIFCEVVWRLLEYVLQGNANFLYKALYFKISLLIQYVICNYLYNLQANSELKVTPSNVFQWINILQLSWLSTKKHNKKRKRMMLKLSNNSMGKWTLCRIQHWFIKSRFFSHRKKLTKKTVWLSDIRICDFWIQYSSTHTWLIFYCKQSEREWSVKVKWLQWYINITIKSASCKIMEILINCFFFSPSDSLSSNPENICMFPELNIVIRFIYNFSVSVMSHL